MLPSCSAGDTPKVPVNGVPGTVAEAAAASGSPSTQTAFVSVQARAGSLIVDVAVLRGLDLDFPALVARGAEASRAGDSRPGHLEEPGRPPFV